jgi:hypothetical protein
MPTEFCTIRRTTFTIAIDGSYTNTITITIPDTILTISPCFCCWWFGKMVLELELLETTILFRTIFVLLHQMLLRWNLLWLVQWRTLTKGTFNFKLWSNGAFNTSDNFIGFMKVYSCGKCVKSNLNATNYVANATQKEIYIRVENENCYTVTTFFINYKKLSIMFTIMFLQIMIQLMMFFC